MKSSRFTFVLLVLIAALVGLALWLRPVAPTPQRAATSSTGSASEATSAAAPGDDSPATADASNAAASAQQLLHAALQRLASARDARSGEALLTFNNADAYRRFLERAQHRGLAVLGQLDALLAVRIRYEDLAAFEAELREFGSAYSRITPNYLVHLPQPPARAERAAIDQVPFGNATLAFLGAASADRSTWGRGVTIAVLDTGVAPDPTFSSERLRYLNVGLGTLPGSGDEDGHGTSVAALAAGEATDAPGVAPAAVILSLRVTDKDSVGDLFTIARALVAATDAGAAIVNVSLGAYAETALLSAAIDYVRAHGAVLVAAAGNDQAAQLAWPAADARVISVGAVDALGRQVVFSNSSPDLQLAAPGYGVQTAWLDSRRVYVNGTSASAPLVAGAIAAVLSQNPGYTADHAWQVVRQTVSDAGAPGADPDYGNGILNLAWALNAANYARADPAIASHYYDAAQRQIDIVIQNRSARALSGLSVDVDTNGSLKSYPLPALAAGASHVLALPLDTASLAADQFLACTSQLVLPFGLEDADLANNRLSSRLPASAVK